MLRVKDYIINVHEVVYIRYLREEKLLFIHLKDDILSISDFQEEEFEIKFKLEDD